MARAAGILEEEEEEVEEEEEEEGWHVAHIYLRPEDFPPLAPEDQGRLTRPGRYCWSLLACKPALFAFVRARLPLVALSKSRRHCTRTAALPCLFCFQ